MLDPEEGRVLQWLVGEYQRQARGPRALDEVEAELRLKRGRLRELLDAGQLAVIVCRGGRGSEKVWLNSQGYAEALNALASLPQRHTA
jgi:hypothetical protein